MPTNYYWYEGTKITLQPSSTFRAVQLSGAPSAETRRGVAAALGAASPQSEGLDLGNGILLFETSPQATHAEAAALPAPGRQLPVFAAADKTPMIVTDEFNVQFKPEVTRARIDQLNAQNKVSIVREVQWERNAFVLAVQKDAETDALTMANRYQESGLTIYAQPNFVRLMKPAFIPNDSLFAQQWALRNTGQGGGGVGQDIHAVSAGRRIEQQLGWRLAFDGDHQCDPQRQDRRPRRARLRRLLCRGQWKRFCVVSRDAA